MATTSLTRVFERTIGLPSVQPTATPVAERPGYIKVRLTYLTNEPKHYRSYQLALMYGLRGPYTEEAFVLMPVRSITSMDFTVFRSAFAFLQRNFIVSRSARLVKVTLLDEDTNTLAYVCK